eukprot:12445483-Alexandrium_andersonii.AAC.1
MPWAMPRHTWTGCDLGAPTKRCVTPSCHRRWGRGKHRAIGSGPGCTLWARRSTRPFQLFAG